MSFRPFRLAAAVLSALSSAYITTVEARPLTLEATPLLVSGGWAKELETAGARLAPLAGFLLRSKDADFGGLSGLLIEGGAARFVTDKGFWIEAALERDGEGRIRAVEGRSIDRMKDVDGGPVSGWRRDAESLARDPGGAVWVGFERVDRIAAYAAPDRPPVAEASQLPTLGLVLNKGVEALAIAPDGALIAIAEAPIEEPGVPQAEAETRYAGWRLIGGRAEPFRIARDGGFSATGADIGPDGALYLLERRFGFLTGVAMRLRRFPDIQARFAAGERAFGPGETLILLGGAAPIDNMEGVAVERGPAGDILITLISDDNFNAFQNTVLLQFRLKR